MVMVQLNKNDQRSVGPVAAQLAVYWRTSDMKIPFKQTLSGLYAEYAVIKYFNYRMGANPQIVFRTEYVNGGDGGFDFEFMGVKWDVKSSKEDFIPKERALKTKAHVIIGVQTIGKGLFDVWGFIPISRIKSVGAINLRKVDMQPLPILMTEKRWFNIDYMRDEQVSSDLTRVDTQVIGALMTMHTNMD